MLLLPLASSVTFFVITNLGMWLFSGFYPLTYARPRRVLHRRDSVLPEHGLAGDLFYAGLLFGGFALARARDSGA